MGVRGSGARGQNGAAPAANTPATAATTSAPAKRVKVEATKMGYYGHARRRVGDVFLLDSADDFSDRWMKRVDPATPEKVTTGNQQLRAEHEQTLRDRAARSTVAPADAGAQSAARDGEDVLE